MPRTKPRRLVDHRRLIALAILWVKSEGVTPGRLDEIMKKLKDRDARKAALNIPEVMQTYNSLLTGEQS